MNRVLVETNGAVRTVTLNRPEKRNAMDALMLQELSQAFEQAPAAEERVTVLARMARLLRRPGLRERAKAGAHSGASQ